MEKTLSKERLDAIGMTPYLYPGFKRKMDSKDIISMIKKMVGEYYDARSLLESSYDRMKLKGEKRSWRTLINSKRRYRDQVEMRQTMMYFIRKHTGIALKIIGAHFSHCDHSTVIHAISQYETLIEYDEQMKRRHEYISNRIKLYLNE